MSEEKKQLATQLRNAQTVADYYELSTQLTESVQRLQTEPLSIQAMQQLTESIIQLSAGMDQKLEEVIDLAQTLSNAQ